MHADPWWQGFASGLVVGLIVAKCVALHWLYTALRKSDPAARGTGGREEE